MKTGKAAGLFDTMIEIIKAGGNVLLKEIANLINENVSKKNISKN